MYKTQKKNTILRANVKRVNFNFTKYKAFCKGSTEVFAIILNIIIVKIHNKTSKKMKTEELNWKDELLSEIKKVQASNTAVRENNTI
jgi:hypothetical protein